MRITTNMLNNLAAKSGFPIRRRTLLDYMNKSSNNTLMSAIGKSQTTATDYISKKNYKKIEDEAEVLEKNSKALLEDGAKDLFQKARNSGNTTELYDSIEKLFEGYNSLIGALDNGGDTMNTFYERMLKQAAENNEENLEKIGVSLKKDGTVKVNMNKLKSVDLDTLEGVLGNDSEFVNKLSFISSRVLDNAQANLESLGNTYNLNGSSYYSGLNTSKYNYWS